MPRASRDVNCQQMPRRDSLRSVSTASTRPSQRGLVWQAPGEGVALQDSDLDLGHMQPTAVDAACSETPPVAECGALALVERFRRGPQACACSDYPAPDECTLPADRSH